jgi:leucyl-tRNA synthetase
LEYSKNTDKKWQERWNEKDVYKYNPEDKGEKIYTLEMFSYTILKKHINCFVCY